MSSAEQTSREPEVILWAPDRAAAEERLAAAGLADVSAVLIVTDRAALPSARPGAALLAWGAAPEGLPAEAVLPADCTARELATCCALLREIVRLRRALAREAQSAGAWRTLAHRDPLTGLANRRGWHEALAQIAQAGVPPRTLGEGATLCLAVLDVDDLKQVNDQHGHAAGDALLQRVAAALVNAIRPHDLAARLGGDEFGLLLAGPPLAGAGCVVERIRQAAGSACGGTLSAGWAAQDQLAAPSGADLHGAEGQVRWLHALWRTAEAELLRAKAAGKDRCRGGLATA